MQKSLLPITAALSLGAGYLGGFATSGISDAEAVPMTREISIDMDISTNDATKIYSIVKKNVCKEVVKKTGIEVKECNFDLLKKKVDGIEIQSYDSDSDGKPDKTKIIIKRLRIHGEFIGKSG